ncbi:hypothetical protein U1Q18_032331 [Sarracenia purpurea var. burkii]
MYLPSSEETSDSKTHLKKKVLPLTLSNTANIPNLIRSPCSPLSASCKLKECEIENRGLENNDVVCGGDTLERSKAIRPKRDEVGSCISSKDGGACAVKQSNIVNVKKMQKMFKTAAEENIRSIKAYVTELKERVAKLQYQKQLRVCQVKISHFMHFL